MTGVRELVVSFRDQADLEAQRPNLEAGGAFAPGVTDLESFQPCSVVLVHPTTSVRLRLAAHVVWLSDHGVGVQFADFEPSTSAALHEFLSSNAQEAARPAPAPPVRNIHVEVRKLSASQRQQLARDGNQTERTALERAFGKTVWEALLRNPKITKPEVARIAQKGTLPISLLELIVDTGAWLTAPQVRRALLSNRSLTPAMVGKVLRATPSAELKLVPKQTAYPSAVRQAAAKMIK